jgi:hypothetical protein
VRRRGFSRRDVADEMRARSEPGRRVGQDPVLASRGGMADLLPVEQGDRPPIAGPDIVTGRVGQADLRIACLARYGQAPRDPGSGTVPTGSHRHPGHQASTRDSPGRFVPRCGRLVSPSGHNQGCVVVDGSFERFTSPLTATNPHPPPQQSPERPNPTPHEGASAADPALRVPFLPSAWAKPQPQASRGTRNGIRPRKPATLEAIRIPPTRLEAKRLPLDACGYLWQVDGRKGTRNPLSSWRSAVRRGHPSNPARIASIGPGPPP